ncbi:FAD-dependent oxidoreductase [Acidobacteria bacterium AB60]|nr:FAD-dependent oxidoreductase [Acidobacteria bacterium AB60]
MPENSPRKTVAVVGGGVAGMSAACALADVGFHVSLLERRGYLGGRASSYLHPGVNEVIDNCQHVIFGCCTNIVGFYERIGVANKIHWTSDMTMIEPGGRRSQLGPFQMGPIRLPAPLHGMPALLRAGAFRVADKLALARAFRGMMKPGSLSNSEETLGDWLRRHRQTEGAMNHFWRLVIASALNADIEHIAVPYAAKVVRELFMNSAEAGSMGMSIVPLSELYDGAKRFLEEHGSCVVLNANVEGLSWDVLSRRWTVTTRTGPVTADYVVMALPFEGLQKLLPGLPQAPGVADLAKQLEQHAHWPICSVHLWFDREITELDHAVLLDREIHWLYNKGKLQPWRELRGSYVELVVSASREFALLSRDQAIAKAMNELAEFFPVVNTARLEKAALIKEVRATFGVPPGIDAARPGAISPWPNLFLAGDWVATGWPSTMESGVRSGHLAAEALSQAAGRAQNFLVPDLRPQGLMKWLR